MVASRFPLVPVLALAAIVLMTACRTIPPPAPHNPPAPPPPLPQAPLPPSATMTLRDYLKQQLGPGFHVRAEWAGTDPAYRPQPYRYRVWAPIGVVRVVTIHHAEMHVWTDTAAMIRAIFRDHTREDGRLDAADVGYHFLVDEAGQVWEGRDAGRVGTHVGSHPPGQNNPGNLGICGLGSFLWEEPPRVMVERIVTLTALIARYYGRPLIVRGHRDWVGIHGVPFGDTSCPGKLERAVVLAEEKMRETYPPGGVAAGGIATSGASVGGAAGVGPARVSTTPASIWD